MSSTCAVGDGSTRESQGQLTATILMDDVHTHTARRLVPVVERKAGLVLVHGFPTGVEVSDTMVHSGP